MQRESNRQRLRVEQAVGGIGLEFRTKRLGVTGNRRIRSGTLRRKFNTIGRKSTPCDIRNKLPVKNQGHFVERLQPSRRVEITVC